MTLLVCFLQYWTEITDTDIKIMGNNDQHQLPVRLSVHH